jgi:hypothetical protein
VGIGMGLGAGTGAGRRHGSHRQERRRHEDQDNAVPTATYASFGDPDGNRWMLQEITERLPGRV